MRRTTTSVRVALIIAILGASSAAASDVDVFGPDAKVIYSADGRVKAVSGISVAAPPRIRESGEAARWFLDKYGAVFGLDADGLAFRQKESHHHLAQEIFHFSVELDGLKVYFRKIVVQVDAKNRIRRVLADVPRVKPGRAAHPLSGSTAVEELAKRLGYPPEAVVGKGWFAGNSGELRPVALVDTLEMSMSNPMSLFVDALNGIVVHAEPIEWTYDPLGAVFPENPATTPEIEIVPMEHLTGTADWLEGDYARVMTCIDTEVCSEAAPLASLRDASGWNFIYRPINDEYSFGDPFAEVNVYHNLTKINAWMRSVFGWRGKLGKNPWIQARVGRAWYNAAFYAGNDERDPFLIFGQDIVDFAYDSDVAYHEFGHAANRTLWEHPWLVGDQFGVDTSMFGIEEAFADIWAENFSGDPVMNSYIVAARTADNDHTCPDALFAEGHYEARILTGFAWDVREQIGAIPWNHIVFRTLSFLDSYVRFDDFVNSLVQSAEDLAAEESAGVDLGHVDVILAAAQARGLGEGDCLNRIVPMSDGQRRLVYGYGAKRTGKLHYPFGIQWKIEAPAEAEAALLVFEWLYPTDEQVEGVEPGYKAHIRRGAPVEVTWLDFDDLEEGDEAFEVTADLTVDGAPTSVIFPYLGLDPLHEGEALYVLISSATEEPTVVLSSEAYFLSKLPLPPDGESADEADGGPAADLDIFTTADNFNCNALNPHTGDSFGGLWLAIGKFLLDY